VLTPLDLAARKVLAIVDRLEARDYTDLYALAHLVGQQICIDSALAMDAGLGVSAIAEAFERVRRIPDDRFQDRATDHQPPVASSRRGRTIYSTITDRAAANQPARLRGGRAMASKVDQRTLVATPLPRFSGNGWSQAVHAGQSPTVAQNGTRARCPSSADVSMPASC
jgi:hypothetical protein